MARPTKLEDELRNRVCELLTAGNYLETAVRAVGLGLSTHYEWMARGEAADDDQELPDDPKERRAEQARRRRERPYVDYRTAVLAALADAEATAVLVIERAGRAGDWRAAAFLLERSHPERWGRKSVRDLDVLAASAGPTGGGQDDAITLIGPDGEPL